MNSRGGKAAGFADTQIRSLFFLAGLVDFGQI